MLPLSSARTVGVVIANTKPIVLSTVEGCAQSSLLVEYPRARLASRHVPVPLHHFRFQEISHDAMSLFRLGVKVTMSLARKDDQLGIRNSLRQDVSAGTVRQVTDDEMIVVASDISR